MESNGGAGAGTMPQAVVGREAERRYAADVTANCDLLSKILKNYWLGKYFKILK